MEARASLLGRLEALQNSLRHCERAKHARQSISQRALAAAWIATSGFALLAMTREVCVHHSSHGEEQQSRVSNHEG